LRERGLCSNIENPEFIFVPVPVSHETLRLAHEQWGGIGGAYPGLFTLTSLPAMSACWKSSLSMRRASAE